MIKVLSVRFLNIARITSGLGYPDVYINFEELPNPFYLFIGVNGSGKTSILHSIHPFAYNTAVGDSSSNSEFIVEGQDGLKNIVYSVDDDIYDINHHYTRNGDSISVKSFIARNGEELNPSGTSGTFKEIVYEVFGLDEAYLGLLSLGNTVDNFVEYTGGTRKQLIMKIFQSLGIYSRYYKNASQHEKNTKALLTNVTTKLEKYRGFDEADTINLITQIECEIDAQAETSRQLAAQTGSLNQKISSNEEFIEEYNNKRTKFLETVDTIDELKRKVNTSKDIPALQSDLEQLTKKINECSINKGSFELNLKSSLDYIQELNTEINDITETLNKMSTDVDLNELDALIASLDKSLTELEVPDDPILDKDGLVKSSIYLDQLKAMCADFIADVYYPDIIADTAKRYLKDKDLLPKSKKKYDDLVNNLQRGNYIKHANAIMGNGAFKIEDYECEEAKGCPYKKFYDDYQAAVSKKAGELDRDIAKRQHDMDLAKDIVTIGTIVGRLTKFISKNKEVFDLPREVFDPETFVDLYMETREVANTDILTSMIDIAEKQQEKMNLTSQLEDARNKRKNNEALRSNYDSLQQRRDNVKDKLERSTKSVEYYKQSLPNIETEIKSLTDTKSKIENAISVLKDLEDCRSIVANLKKELASMEEKSAEIDKIQIELSSLTKQIEDIDSEIDALRKEKESLNMTLNTVTSLRKEYETIVDQYAEAKIVRDAVSPSKGVPLEHIKKFIKGDLINMVNELLEMVFHGKLNINPRDVIINESEFTIPYRKNGTKVCDISRASDGERAILGIAFSLSLARLTSNKYNVLLLDEKDTALDVYNRGKYIDIIDAYRKIIKCQQVFNVTHNSMFDNYPVNIIMTSDMAVSYNTKNIIKLWR